MIDEGVISILNTLARGSETKTRRICAVILQNMSASKNIRVDMVSRSTCVQVAYNLSSDQDPIVLRCIGITLARLSQEEANWSRIITDGGINALCNVSVKYPTVPGISQTVATAMQLISSHSSHNKQQLTLVQEGCVTAIASLLRLSTDVTTLQQSLLSLCNVLTSKDTHLHIVQQGMLNTLVTLSEHENELMRGLCALAFLNMSVNEDSHKHLINTGVVAALIALSAESAPVIRRRCSATLCNVANYDPGVSRMVADDAIPALVRLMETKDVEAMRNCCAAFCRLCNSADHGKLILESGAVSFVIQGAMHGDLLTKQYCGSLLCVMTAYPSCRIKLVKDFGVLDAFNSLADQDELTKQQCLVAYANLSCEEELHEDMMSKSVVSVIHKLVHTSYQEFSQTCCATAICNLAYYGNRVKILEEQGLNTLLMISMVRSVNDKTKMQCVVALNNLFEEDTMDFLLNEVGTVATLCKTPDEDIANLCARMFNQFSLTLKGQTKMIEKANVLPTLFGLVVKSALTEHGASLSAETRVISAHTMANLIMSKSGDVRRACFKCEPIFWEALTKGLQINDELASLHCIVAFHEMSTIPESRWAVGKTKVTEVLLGVAATSKGEKNERCLKIISMLASYKGTTSKLQSTEIMSNLMNIGQRKMHPSSVTHLANTIQCLTAGYPDLKELLDLGIFNVIRQLMTVDDEEVMQCVACTLRSLLDNPKNIPLLAHEESIKILHTIVSRVSDSDTLYNVAICIFRFAVDDGEGSMADCRDAIAIPTTIQVMQRVVTDADSHGLIAAAMYYFTHDINCTRVFSSEVTVAICADILDQSHDESIQLHMLSALFCISKLSSGRGLLVGPPTNVALRLMTLLKTCSPRLKGSCSKVLRNLSTTATEGLEAGAVKALIELSLDVRH
jgi:hypothetical protein